MKSVAHETVTIKDGKPVGKFNAADRKRSREAMQAIANIALSEPPNPKDTLMKVHLDKDGSTVEINGETKDLNLKVRMSE